MKQTAIVPYSQGSGPPLQACCKLGIGCKLIKLVEQLQAFFARHGFKALTVQWGRIYRLPARLGVPADHRMVNPLYHQLRRLLFLLPVLHISVRTGVAVNQRWREHAHQPIYPGAHVFSQRLIGKACIGKQRVATKLRHLNGKQAGRLGRFGHIGGVCVPGAPKILGLLGLLHNSDHIGVFGGGFYEGISVELAKLRAEPRQRMGC